MADPAAAPQADPNAGAYPPPQQQGYPQQPAYPPQPQQQPGYYPPPAQQPGYPPQQPAAAYPPPQPGYPDVKPAEGTAPPPYYQPQPTAVYQPQPVATTQTTTNVVVVQQQPTVATVQTTIYHRRYGSNDHGLVFAIAASCIVFWCGGWCGLICTIAAIYFALQAQEQDHSGNTEASLQNHKWSYILSVVGLVVGFAFLFIYIISGAAR